MLDQPTRNGSRSANPRRRLADYVPAWIKVFIKEKLSRAPHHNLIIPATANHAAWFLGAQPGVNSIRSLHQEGGNKPIHLVSMLANFERAVDLTSNPNIGTLTPIPWFDHGTLSLTTGQNETVAFMHNSQDELYQSFFSNSEQETFYCHCMAGRSRSFVETMAFIYFYPDKAKLFDFDDAGWDEIRDKIPLDLQIRLHDNPSFSDIAEFVTILRPKVKSYAHLDDDQAGLLGLMALSNLMPKNLQDLDHEELQKHALDIGMMLKAQLDQSLRNEVDRLEQKKNFEEVFDKYAAAGFNLLLEMLPAVPKETANMRDSGRFEMRFRNLSASEQARFAILMKELELTLMQREPNLTYPLGLPDDANHYAIVALEKVGKFTAGDQLEFLKTFASTDVAKSAKFPTYESIAKKLVGGNLVDRYDAGNRLAELYFMALKDDHNMNFITRALRSNKMSYAEQYKFLKKLDETPGVNIDEVRKYAGIISANYNNRWFKRFNSPLLSTEAEHVRRLVDATNAPSYPPTVAVEAVGAHPSVRPIFGQTHESVPTIPQVQQTNKPL